MTSAEVTPDAAHHEITRRSAIRATAAAVGASASGTLPPFLTGALALQIQRDLGIGDAAFGAALSVIFATGGFGVMLAGTVVDRRGWRFGIRGTALFTLIAVLGIALLARSVWMLAAGMFVAGLAQAQAGPSGSLAIVEEVPPTRRGTGFGIKQAAGPSMAMLSGLAVPFIALTIGWRWAFAFAAIVPALTLLAVPRGHTRPRAPHRPPASTVLRDAIRAPSMLLFTIAAAFGMASIGALTSFIVVSSVAHGLSEAGAGGLVTGASLVGLVFRVLSGWLTDRLELDGFETTLYLLTAGGLGFLLLAVDDPVVTVVGALIAYSGGWGWTGLMQYGAVTAHPQSPASAAAIVQAGMSVGAALGPLGYGVLSGVIGYGGAWLVIAASTWTAAALVFVGLVRLRGRTGITPAS